MGAVPAGRGLSFPGSPKDCVGLLMRLQKMHLTLPLEMAHLRSGTSWEMRKCGLLKPLSIAAIEILYTDTWVTRSNLVHNPELEIWLGNILWVSAQYEIPIIEANLPKPK